MNLSNWLFGLYSVSFAGLARVTTCLLLLGMSSVSLAQGFQDDFDRPDAAALGNGWIEKAPGALALAGGRAVKLAVSSTYTDNLAYRPATENLLDVESSVEFQLQSLDIGFPQLFTRVQSDSVVWYGILDAYILYIDNSTTFAVLGRQTGWEFVTALDVLTLSSPLNTNDTYRLRMSVVGTDPVQLNAFVERQGASGWEVIGQSSITDAENSRITTAGSVGFGGYVEASYSFDNFARTDLGGGGGTNNPAPVATSLAPNSTPTGSNGFVLTVQGSDFVQDAVVRWDGVDRATTFVSANELQITVDAADLAVARTVPVTAFNPAPGGGESSALNFTISDPAGNPVPGVTTLAPNTATAGGSAFLLTVQGTAFVPESVVRWNGADRQTAYISPTELQATIGSADIGTAGTALVSVFSPGPGGGVSNAEQFVIDPVAGNPVPTLGDISPASIVAGSAGITLTVQGWDFLADSVVRWNGQDRPTVYVSTYELRATLNASDFATPGSFDVSVWSPTPGGGESNSTAFEVTTGGGSGNNQSLSNVSPNTAIIGGAGFQMTITGVGFTPSSIARVDGTDVTTTYVTGNQLFADIPAAMLSTGGRAALTVFTPDASNSASDPLPLFVVAQDETVFFDGFNRPNSPTLDNGWTEKTADSFRLEGGEVASIYTPSEGFTDAIAYRPDTEDAQNIEVGVEFIRAPGSVARYPQVHARIQRDSIPFRDMLSSYTLFYDDGWSVPGITITTIDGWGECYLASWPLTVPFVQGERYRLRFIVTGADPVQLTGYMDLFSGDSWQEIATGTVYHDDSTTPVPGLFCNTGDMVAPVNGTGGTGIAKWLDQTDNYDNYYTIALGGSDNPVPSPSTLSPSSISEGSSGFQLTVTGSGFTSGAVARWNGADRPTTVVSSTEVRAAISAADVASAGTASVTVRNPAPGGGESSPLQFDITAAGNPVPGISSLTPGSATVGGSAFALTVYGTGFVPGSTVRWNGADRSTTFVSSTELQAAISAGDVATEGAALVSVFNSGPGGGESADTTFTISTPTAEFLDDFNRPDGPNLGNGWIEKTPAAVDLVGGVAAKQTVGTGYRDNLVYRPASENVLNVEASVDLRIRNTAIGYPQVLVRVQSSTAGFAEWLDGYILYVDNNATQAVLGRNRNGDFVEALSIIGFTTPLNTTDQFRMRLRATGTNPVMLEAYVERNGANGWEIIGSGVASDSSANRFDTAGSVGFGGYVENSYEYDNFRRTELSQ